LVINGKVIAKDRNMLHKKSDWISHAEMRLFIKYSALIKKRRKEGATVTLYTTMEPCLMCLGTSALHRVSKIVYACPDPFTGAANIKREALPVGYETAYRLPKVKKGPMKEESRKLLLEYMRSHEPKKWRKAIELITNL